MNVGIINLPDEVLIYILSLVSSYKDLRNCCQVCHQWRYCAKEVAYQKKKNFIKAVSKFNLTWTKIEQYQEGKDNSKLIISKRYSHSALYDETDNIHSVFVFGGCTSTSTTFNDLWRLDPTTREWSKPLATGAYPSPKACATFVKSKPGQLILFGGWSHPSPYPLHQSWRLFNELHTYDIPTMRWTQINPSTSLKPPTMAGHSATVHRGQMIVFGGLQKQRNHIGQFSSSNDVWSFDLESETWTQEDIPEPRPKARYGQSQLYLDENHLLIIGGCGGPNHIYNDIWVLSMKSPHWKWTQCDIKNPEHGSGNMWCHPACKIGNYAVVLGKNIHPKADKDHPDNSAERSVDRWQNFIPQVRRGLNRGYGAIRRHGPPPEQGQKNSPYTPPSRQRAQRLPDQDDEDDSTTSNDDTEMLSEESDDPGMAVEPVGQSPSSQVFRTTAHLRVNGCESKTSDGARASSSSPSTSETGSGSGLGSHLESASGFSLRSDSSSGLRPGAPAHPGGATSVFGSASAASFRSGSPLASGLGSNLRRPMPRMLAFAVGVPSSSNSLRDPGEPPSAKRKQIEMQKRRLDSLKRMDERYKSLEKKTKDDEEEAAAKAKEPKLSLSAKQEKPQQKKSCPCNKMSMFVLDISKAVSDNVVEWLQFFSNNYLETPEVAILYSLVAGRGELIMFGGLQKDVAMMRNQAAATDNDSVTNALYFLTPPPQIV